jgi:hypothetical protein
MGNFLLETDTRNDAKDIAQGQAKSLNLPVIEINADVLSSQVDDGVYLVTRVEVS